MILRSFLFCLPGSQKSRHAGMRVKHAMVSRFRAAIQLPIDAVQVQAFSRHDEGRQEYEKSERGIFSTGGIRRNPNEISRAMVRIFAHSLQSGRFNLPVSNAPRQ